MLSELRAFNEPFMNALAEPTAISPPPPIAQKDAFDDWQISAWDDLFPSIRQTLNKMIHYSERDSSGEFSVTGHIAVVPGRTIGQV